MSGWIKLRRSLVDWEWYDDHNATRLLIHLNVAVNYEDKKWKGITIKAGSMVYSWETLSKAVGLSIQQTRTAMSKLVLSGEVTRYPTNKFQLLSLTKWDKFQSKDESLTDKQQSNNNQITTTKEDKEYKEDIYSENDFLINWGEARKYYLNVPTEIKSLNFNERNNFNKIIIDWKKEEIRLAIHGLFKQKNKNIASMYLRPNHFLENVEKYYNAYISRTFNLYGESNKKTEL